MPEIPNFKLPVSELSSRKVVKIPSSSSMKDVARYMNESNLDAIFVKINDKLSIITKNDFVRLAENNTNPEISVEKILSKNL